MDNKTICNRAAKGLICTASCFLFACFSAGTSTGTEVLDTKADELFKSMSSYLGNTKEFTVDADIDFEIVTSDGQKLQLSSFSKKIIKRPSKLYIGKVGLAQVSSSLIPRSPYRQY